MSNKGMFTALSGAIAQSQRLDTIANNIANSNTAAFKKDNQVFKEYLTALEKPADVIQVPRVPSSIESFYDLQSADRGYVDSAGTFTDHSQGGFRPTGNPLDLAIEGDGFFEVLTADGPKLTRSGQLKLDAEGFLVSKEGFPILLEGQGGDPESRKVKLNSGNVTISPSGQIFENAEPRGRLSLVAVNDLDGLQKQGSSLYAIKPNYNVDVRPSEASVQQGFVETSNVNIVKEMTDMIAATRSFESAQKAIQAFDQMNGRLVNEVPKVGR